MPPTMRAHCGACAAPMVLCSDYTGIYFWCPKCGVETPARETVAAADLDVVWVPATTPIPRLIPLIVAALALLLAMCACGDVPNCASYECRTFGCIVCEGTP